METRECDDDEEPMALFDEVKDVLTLIPPGGEDMEVGGEGRECR